MGEAAGPPRHTVGRTLWRPCRRQDATSGTPLLQQAKEEEAPSDGGLASDGPCQATQGLEGKFRRPEPPGIVFILFTASDFTFTLILKVAGLIISFIFF